MAIRGSGVVETPAPHVPTPEETELDDLARRLSRLMRDEAQTVSPTPGEAGIVYSSRERVDSSPEEGDRNAGFRQH